MLNKLLQCVMSLVYVVISITFEFQKILALALETHLFIEYSQRIKTICCILRLTRPRVCCESITDETIWILKN